MRNLLFLVNVFSCLIAGSLGSLHHMVYESVLLDKVINSAEQACPGFNYKAYKKLGGQSIDGFQKYRTYDVPMNPDYVNCISRIVCMKKSVSDMFKAQTIYSQAKESCEDLKSDGTTGENLVAESPNEMDFENREELSEEDLSTVQHKKSIAVPIDSLFFFVIGSLLGVAVTVIYMKYSANSSFTGVGDMKVIRRRPEL